MSEPRPDSDYLDAFAELERPSDAARDRTWAAIEAATTEADPAGTTGRATLGGSEARSTSAAQPPAVRPRVVVLAIVAVAAAVLLAIALNWSGSVAREDEAGPQQAPYENKRGSAGGDAVDRRHGEARAQVDDRRGARQAPEPTAGPPPTPGPSDAPDETAAPGEETPGRSTTPPAADARAGRRGDGAHGVGRGNGGRNRASQRRGGAERPGDAAGDADQPATEKGVEPHANAAGSPSRLAEETALLRAVQEALVQGRANAALGKVAAYRQRFPNGVFRNEVTVAKAEALCRVGRPDQARAIVDAFVRRHPRSHLVARAKRICPG